MTRIDEGGNVATLSAFVGSMNEHEHQTTVFQMARLYQRDIPELGLLFAIPNGGHRQIGTARKMKAEGVQAGVPDMLLPVARQGFHGLFIEMKVKPNKPSSEQRAWIEALQAQGYLCEVCYSWIEAVRVIWGYLGQECPIR